MKASLSEKNTETVDIRTYTIGELGALYGLCELSCGVTWVVAVVDNGLIEVLDITYGCSTDALCCAYVKY